jgi:exopolyphosphatase / guanosine-5'-triphosphate,3'-diphosphate pyrophosphatase
VRLAAIDVGSNSVHMVVADVSAGGHIQVVDRMKEMVRLGRRAFTTGKLAPGAMDLAVHALGTFARLARVRGVERLQAVATSAVREARNGPAFVRRLRRDTGLTVRVISGPEEARLIFNAARHALGLEGGPHLLVDVGGGSVELVLVQDGRALWMRSLPLGVARLTDRFLGADPPSRGQIRRLERHLDHVVGRLLARVRHAGVHRAVGTSGTINTLVAMARAGRGQDPARLHGANASAKEIARLRARILGTDAEKRADLPGMDAKRVDLMPAAAVLVDFLLRRSGAGELTACTWALREGLLLDLARLPSQRRAGSAHARRRSVEALATKFVGENAHGQQVARLALAIFDATARALRLSRSARELLEYAALIHDIGHAIDHDRHHRHTEYLIRNAELLGFDPDEIEVIAQVARGHRKQTPKVAGPELHSLPAPRRRDVRALTAIIRVADGLDRTRFGVVKAVEPVLSEDRLLLRLDIGGADAELELWAAERRSELLARLLERPLELRPVPGHALEPAPAVARRA